MSVSVSWHRNLVTFICLQLRNPWMKLKGCLSSANPTAWPVTRYCVAIPGTAELSWSGSAGLTFFEVSIWPDWTNGVLAHSISHQKVLNCKSHSLMNSMLFSFDQIWSWRSLSCEQIHSMPWYESSLNEGYGATGATGALWCHGAAVPAKANIARRPFCSSLYCFSASSSNVMSQVIWQLRQMLKRCAWQAEKRRKMMNLHPPYDFSFVGYQNNSSNYLTLSKSQYPGASFPYHLLDLGSG